MWRATPPRTVWEGQWSALLLGVPYDATVTYRVVNDFCAGPLATAAATASTGPLPAWVPQAEILTSDPTGWDSDAAYFLTSMHQADDSNLFMTMIIDRQGDVVWARQHPRFTSTIHPRLSYDGADLLLDSNTWWTTFDPSLSEVHRMKIDGSSLIVHHTPGLHHPFTETSDGAIIWGAFDGQDELLMELPPTGIPRTIWSCKDFLSARGLSGDCASNTVSWQPSSDHLLFSFYTLETVFEIDRSTGDTLRWFGHLDGSWRFDPPESTFWWQHGGYYLPDGNLLISAHRYDDGPTDGTEDGTGESNETVVREYRLNEATETLEEVWNFGLDLGVNGEEMGEPHRLANGNTLHNYGTTPRLRETTSDGTIVWDIQWDMLYIGRSTPIADLYTLYPEDP